MSENNNPFGVPVLWSPDAVKCYYQNLNFTKIKNSPFTWFSKLRNHISETFIFLTTMSKHSFTGEKLKCFTKKWSSCWKVSIYRRVVMEL